jgi:hypothetical protein
MRNRDVRNRLDFLDLDYSQVGEPAVEAEERVVIGADALWRELAGDGMSEYPTDGNTIDCRALIRLRRRSPVPTPSERDAGQDVAEELLRYCAARTCGLSSSPTLALLKPFPVIETSQLE